MKQQQRGMAVLMVLLLITMMVLLAVNTNERFFQALRRADSGQFALQAKWSLLGAEDWLLHHPMISPQPERTQQLQLEDNLIHYRWQDRQACFNLNALSERNQVAKKVFLQLLRNFSLSDEQGKALTDSLIARVHQGEFSEISQLREHPDITSRLWQQLQPLVCTLPAGQLAINVNGLTPVQLPLFSALFDGVLSPEQARNLLASRPPSGWENKAQILASAFIGTDNDAVSTLLSVVVMHSEAWELLAWVEENRRSYSLRSRLHRQDEQITVTSRLYGISE